MAKIDAERIEAIRPIQTGRKIVENALAFLHDLEKVERVREIVRETLQEHEDLGLSTYTKIAAVHGFVASAINYVRDPKGIEFVYSPKRLVERLANGDCVMEDCDTFAGLTLAMLWALGIQARLVLVGYLPVMENAPPRYQHVFAQAFLPAINRRIKSRWVVVDPSLGKRADEMAEKIQTAFIIDPFSAAPHIGQSKKKTRKKG